MAIGSARQSLLADDDDSYEKKYRLQHRRGFLSLLSQCFRSRRVLIIIGCALLFIFVVSYQAPVAAIGALTVIPERALDASLLRDLASPLKGYEKIKSADGNIYVVGDHHGVASDISEDYEWIDPYQRGPFAEAMFTNGMTNNAMAQMPVGSEYDMLVIGRGRSDMWYDKKEQNDFVNVTLIGFFVKYNEIAEDWIRAGPEPYVLDIPVWRQSPRPCDNVVSAGGTDPRFIWSDAGEPLAIISTSSRAPGVCQSQGMVDLRAVWPDFKKHMASIGYDEIPIRFDTFTEIGRTGKAQKHEENWAPFFPGAQPVTDKSGDRKESKRDTDAVELTLGDSTWPLFTAKLNNRTIVKVNEKLEIKDRAPDSYVLSEPISLELPKDKKGRKQEANYECLFSSLPKGWDRNEFQHATPLHRVTLCDRGSCTPSQNNTVLLSLVHYKKERRNYRRAFITTEVEAPYRMLSVSPLMHFGTAESDESSVFSLSLSFIPTNKGAIWGENPFNKTEDTPGGWLNHGWLDDKLVIGTGLRDEAFDAVHLDASAALRGHTLCQ